MSFVSSRRSRWLVASVVALATGGCASQPIRGTGAADGRAPAASQGSWTFAISGDSRNCGNVVMPAIAAGAKAHDIGFYWHLGDFRRNSGMDEDFAREPEYQDQAMSKEAYQGLAWGNFIERELAPFEPTPVYLAIGNHEMVGHDRKDYVTTFKKWLDLPLIREARAKDGVNASSIRPYFHWTQGGVDFISLDNATKDQFDREQISWFKKVLAQDESDDSIKAIVVGMHAALPGSISSDHSMSERIASEPNNTFPVDSGREVYRELLRAQQKFGKRVYAIASHSHYYMDGIFNTAYWKANGGVLPGWIVGTAGAARYPLPRENDLYKQSNKAMEKVYGYLLATVSPDGEIRFDFQPISKADIPEAIRQRYGADLVDYCFDKNASFTETPISHGMN